MGTAIIDDQSGISATIGARAMRASSGKPTLILIGDRDATDHCGSGFDEKSRIDAESIAVALRENLPWKTLHKTVEILLHRMTTDAFGAKRGMDGEVANAVDVVISAMRNGDF